MDWDRLGRYLAGECSAAEAAAFERWVDERPERRRLVDSMQELWQAGLAPGEEPGAATAVEAAWDRVARRMAGVEPAPPRVLPFRRAAAVARRLPRARTALAAAAVLALAVAGTLLWRERLESPAPRLLATATGERQAFLLDDGTHVMLGASSRLEVPGRFGRGQRTVVLEGEALFDATHEVAAPFTVHAGGAAARDLGTRFVVRSLGGLGGAVEVVVAEGAVALRLRGGPAGRGLTLRAGDLGRLAASGRAEIVHGVDLERELAWTRGELVFQDTPLSVVAVQLRRWYGLEVHIADPRLASRRLTAVFRNEPVAEVLEVIARAAGAEYRRAGGRYELSAARNAGAAERNGEAARTLP